MVRSANMLLKAATLAAVSASVSAHIALWHPSMWGFNVTDKTFPIDNRPVIPLMDMTFDQWWWHGFLNYPPHKGDFFELPAGGTATAELACHKGATSYWASSEGPDVRQGNWPCPDSPSTAFHANSQSDVSGCGMAITYKSNEFDVQPEDFAVFSTNRNCVWTRFTDFQVPAAMPACPPEGCICSWFWIHAPDSGSEQNYMTPFRCKVTGAKSTAPVMKAQLPRRCGADIPNGRMQADTKNCTVGAKQPFYWYQKERNNMNEGTYSPPQYNELYGYDGGACNDIFEGSSGGSSNNQQQASSSSHASTASSSFHTAVAASTQVAVNNNPATVNNAAATSGMVKVASTSKPTETASSTEKTSFTPISQASSASSSNTGTPTSFTLTASAASTRKCKSRKTKRAELAPSPEKRTAAAHPHKNHPRNIGRLIADTSL